MTEKMTYKSMMLNPVLIKSGLTKINELKWNLKMSRRTIDISIGTEYRTASCEGRYTVFLLDGSYKSPYDLNKALNKSD